MTEAGSCTCGRCHCAMARKIPALMLVEILHKSKCGVLDTALQPFKGTLPPTIMESLGIPAEARDRLLVLRTKFCPWCGGSDSFTFILLILPSDAPDDSDESGPAPTPDPKRCCDMNRKVKLGIGAFLPESECGVSDAVMADFMRFDLKSPVEGSRKPVIQVKHCVWCGAAYKHDHTRYVSDISAVPIGEGTDGGEGYLESPDLGEDADGEAWKKGSDS